MTKSQYAELSETSEKHSIGLLEFVAEDGEPLCTYSTVHHSVVTAESHRHHTGCSVAGEGQGGEGRGGEGWIEEDRPRKDMGGEGLHC